MREGREDNGGDSGGGGGGAGPPRPSRFSSLLHSDPMIKSVACEDDFPARDSSASAGASPGYYSDRSSNNTLSGESSPFAMSPWNQSSSPYAHSPWSHTNPFADGDADGAAASLATGPDLFPPGTGLIGSLVREEGHIYSLAAIGDLLYTGSDSKNIRVWKDQKEYSGFKSSSGLVKAIIISSDRVFTGHQDGKIRVWRVSPKNPKVHKRIGTLPRLKDFLKSSLNPSNYVESRRRHGRSAVWIRHSDAVSCLSMDEEHGLLYSGSWDRTFKVWRMSDSKCLESVHAHDDTVNAVVAGPEGLVFTGSADGTVKVWRRESILGSTNKGGTRHTAAQTLLKQECAVTALVVGPGAEVVYCGSSDGLVNFWERERGLAHGGVLRGHKQAVLCLAAAGGLVFSGSADKTICVWRREGAAVHVCLSVLTGHTGPVKCLAVEADTSVEAGRPRRWVVYSGSLDKSVKVWKVAEQPPEALMQAQQYYGGSDEAVTRGVPQFDNY